MSSSQTSQDPTTPKVLFRSPSEPQELVKAQNSIASQGQTTVLQPPVTSSSIPQTEEITGTPTGKRRASKSPESNSGSNPETKEPHMSSRSSSKYHSSSSKKHSSSSKSESKRDDWSDITDPEERRRIQNRIAQRKFREKTRDQRERSERESRNREHAGSSYRTPYPDDIAADEELSGLPWGSLSMRHVVSRGHESESRHGSRRDEYNQNDGLSYPQYAQGGYQGYGSGGSRGSAGGDDQLYDYDDSSYRSYDYDNRRGGSSRS